MRTALLHLFVFGVISDWESGSLISLGPAEHATLPWRIFVEVPTQLELKDGTHSTNVHDQFPLLSLVAKMRTLGPEDPLDLDDNSRLVCRFIRAYLEIGKITRKPLIDSPAKDSSERGLDIENWFQESSDEELRASWNQLLDGFHPKLPNVGRKKMHQKMCLRYLARRCRFLVDCPQFRFGTIPGFGSYLMEQFFKEADHFCNVAVYLLAALLFLMVG